MKWVTLVETRSWTWLAFGFPSKHGKRCGEPHRKRWALSWEEVPDPPKAWIVPSLISEPRKLSAIDFLSISLEKVNQHVQVVSDSPQNIRGHSQHEISRSLQERRCCGKRFWWTLVSLSGYTLTKAVTLNPELLKICARSQLSRDHNNAIPSAGEWQNRAVQSHAPGHVRHVWQRSEGPLIRICCPNEWSKWL